MEPAQTIIGRCGGIAVIARWLGLDHSTVRRWTYTREQGGTGGHVPAKHQTQLLGIAVQNGVQITPADFFCSSSQVPEPERAPILGARRT